ERWQQPQPLAAALDARRRRIRPVEGEPASRVRRRARAEPSVAERPRHNGRARRRAPRRDGTAGSSGQSMTRRVMIARGTAQAVVCAAALVACSSLAWSAEPDLIAAVKAGNAAAITQLLAQHADVNQAQPDGTTALHWAARRNDLATVRRLLEAG